MSAQIAAWGRLGQAPRQLSTQSGKAMAVASIAVDLADPREGDAPPEWIGIVAFDDLANVLVKHAKGECLSVSGRLQRRTFTGGDGQERTQLQVIADALVSARTVRPGGGKQNTGSTLSEKHAAADRAQRPLKHERGR